VNPSLLVAAFLLLGTPADAQDPDPFVERKLATLPDDVPLPAQHEVVSVGPGGKRVAWTKPGGPKQSIVVLDGVPCAPIEGYGSLWWESLSSSAVIPWTANLWGSIWSTDGKHVAWLGVRGAKRILIVDGVEGEACDSISSLSLSSDWSRIAYVGEEGKKSVAVLDGKKFGAEHERVEAVSLSADGRRFGYQAWGGNRRFLVADGKVVEGKYRWLSNLHFSPDGTRMAFVGLDDKGEHVVLDGVEGSPYDVIRFVKFSPDGRRLAYEGRLGRKWHMVVDGVQGPAFDEVEANSFRFSPDSKRTVYLADHQLILNGEVQRGQGFTSDHLTLSPDGKRLAYLRRSDFGGSQLVVDGVVYAGNTDSMVFSPSGRHVAWIDRRRVVVVNRLRGPEFDAILGPPTFSSDDKKVAYPVRKGREILWKVEDVLEERGAGLPAAVADLGKVRSVLENSESYQLRIDIKSDQADRPGDGPRQTRVRVWANANRAKLIYEDPATGSSLALVSDGKAVESLQTDGTGKRKPIRYAGQATDDYREDLSHALSTGIPLDLWFVNARRSLRIVDVQPLPDADGKKGLSYLLLQSDNGMVATIQAWVDPKTFALSKRIVTVKTAGLDRKFIETFEEFLINPVIPEAEFRLPEKK
jgi:Tol biopolymer transport system component